MRELLESIWFTLLGSTFISLDVANHCIDSSIRYNNYLLWQLKWEAKESQDQLTHVHTAHWEYIKRLVPWQIRLWFSRRRGKKWALKWRIKLFSLFRGIGPKVAQLILEEYMITTKLEDLLPPPNTWVCPHCGTANTDTALFCKGCGEYK